MKETLSLYRKNLLQLQLTLVAIVSLLGLGWLSWTSYFDYRRAEVQLPTISQTEAVRAKIIHLDEILTMSARMAAASGDLKWEARYREFEPQLEQAINEALLLEPDASEGEAAARTNAANIALVAMENHAFDLIRQGKNTEAQQLLSNSEYESHKSTYTTGMMEFSNYLLQTSDSMRSELLANLRHNVITTVVAVILLILGSLFIFRATRRWQKAIIENNRQLSQMTVELEKLNDQLDMKVNERTRELQESMRQHMLAARRAEFLAYYDELTDLPHRSLFIDRLGQMLDMAKRTGQVAGCMFIDLDRFKTVNDTYGHIIGDKLLKLVALRLQECVRKIDTVGRLSGDEFAIAMANLARADDANRIAQKVISVLAHPFDLDGHQTYVTASLGIALYPDDGEDAEVLLKNADTAMFRAKEQGRNVYQFYLPEMNDRAAERLKMEMQLRGALERGEFLLHYQPKANLASGEISGFEALLRWQHPERGLVPPLEFIPILEETGFIVTVGEWALRTTCAQIKYWREQGLPSYPIAVNLSARQFQEKNLNLVITTIIADYGIDPGLLEIEVTESMLMSNAEEATQTLKKIHRSGVKLAIDDFGTGYSSLAYLRRFPIDVLKIDRAFIRNAATDPNDATIVLAVISLAHSMKLKVIAEGVETEAQANFLRMHGCDEIQGYYFAKPMPVAECARALLEKWHLTYQTISAVPGARAILLVDDNPDDLELLKRVLAPDGYHIVTANSAAAGFELLARSTFQMVISDYKMPGMTGIDFLASVRILYPNSLRIVVSGIGDMDTVTEAVNAASIHKYLGKDWEPAQLRAAVREASLSHP